MPDGSIVLMGGSDGITGYKNDVWQSTNNGLTWTQMTTSAGWSARYSHSSVAMPDGSIVLMGGYDGFSGFKNDTWRSTNNGLTWTQMTASAGWSARAGQRSVAMPDGSIVLMGGGDWTIGKHDVWRSTDYGATWTLVNESAVGITSGHSCVVMPDSSIVLMGGLAYGPVYKNDVWRSTDYGTTWTQVNTHAGWTGRYDHSSVAMPDGSIVLMGGEDRGGYKNDVWRSTDNGVTWSQLKASAGWSVRTGQNSVVMPDGTIVMIGGFNSSYMNDIWQLESHRIIRTEPVAHLYYGGSISGCATGIQCRRIQ